MTSEIKGILCCTVVSLYIHGIYRKLTFQRSAPPPTQTAFIVTHSMKHLYGFCGKLPDSIKLYGFDASYYFNIVITTHQKLLFFRIYAASGFYAGFDMQSMVFKLVITWRFLLQAVLILALACIVDNDLGPKGP